VRDFFQLEVNRRIDLGILMPMQVRPNRRIGIQVFSPSNVAQHSALAGGNDNRFTPQPVAHLREGMPDKPVIEFGKTVHLNF
jgi:hypothetical protein